MFEGAFENGSPPVAYRTHQRTTMCFASVANGRLRVRDTAGAGWPCRSTGQETGSAGNAATPTTTTKRTAEGRQEAARQASRKECTPMATTHRAGATGSSSCQA
eukprot:15870132-Heterocapsa_arctica.AAC.1